MTKISIFFRDILRSCYDMEFYRVVRTRPLFSAFKYLALFTATLAGVTTLLLVPPAIASLGRAREVVHLRIPDDATFTFRDGKLTTTAHTPLELGSGKFPFVIDPSVTGDTFPPAFSKDSGILIGRDAVFVQQGRSERRIYSLSVMPDGSYAKSDLESWVGRLGAFLTVLFVLLIGVVLFVGPFVASVAYAAFTSLLLLGIGRIWQVKVPYAVIFAMGLHALTLPALLRFTFSSFRTSIPFVFTVVYFMIMIAALADERARPAIAAKT